jgi:hypothetical protein
LPLLASGEVERIWGDTLALPGGVAHAVAQPAPAVPGYWSADAVPAPPEKLAMIDVSNRRSSKSSTTGAAACRKAIRDVCARRESHPRRTIRVFINIPAFSTTEGGAPVPRRTLHPSLTRLHNTAEPDKGNDSGAQSTANLQIARPWTSFVITLLC